MVDTVLRSIVIGTAVKYRYIVVLGANVFLYVVKTGSDMSRGETWQLWVGRLCSGLVATDATVDEWTGVGVSDGYWERVEQSWGRADWLSIGWYCVVVIGWEI